MRAQRSHAWDEFIEFCSRFALQPEVGVFPLYLTWLSESGWDSRAIVRRVSAIELHVQVATGQSWRTDALVQGWLRGYFRDSPYGRTAERADPLYAEQVIRLVEACLEPTPRQRIQVAAMVLAHETQLPAIALARIAWRDLRFRSDSVEVTAPPFDRRGRRGQDRFILPRRSGVTCPVLALRQARLNSSSLFVLGGKGGKDADTARVLTYLEALPSPAPGGHRRRERLSRRELATRLTRVLVPEPQASRDLALITLAHHLALKGSEAIDLRQRDVRPAGTGLIVIIPGRREHALLQATGRSDCPVAAWRSWTKHLTAQGRRHGAQRAFLRVSGTRIWDRPMIPAGLAYVTAQRVEQAQLSGAFTFSSLRIGAIRGWVREGRRELLIARDAGLLSLSAVAVHERRETLIEHSIAGRVGL